jgi:Putative Actinobacterial Holin-X, holin superfamily III
VSAKKAEPDVPTLVADVAADARKLAVQQFELFRAELAQSGRAAGRAVGTTAAGGGLMAAGGLLAGVAAAHLVRGVTGLPLWVCYGLAAVGSAAAGRQLIRTGVRDLSDVRLLPKTIEAAGENVLWLRDRATA